MPKNLVSLDPDVADLVKVGLENGSQLTIRIGCSKVGNSSRSLSYTIRRHRISEPYLDEAGKLVTTFDPVNETAE
jgi:hypothetical protein